MHNVSGHVALRGGEACAGLLVRGRPVALVTGDAGGYQETAILRWPPSSLIPCLSTSLASRVLAKCIVRNPRSAQGLDNDLTNSSAFASEGKAMLQPEDIPMHTRLWGGGNFGQRGRIALAAHYLYSTAGTESRQATLK